MIVGARLAGPGGVGAVQDRGLARQWQPGRWQRVARLVSEPGRAMPIRASSGLDLLVAAGQVVHGDRIPYPPRRRHPPAPPRPLYFKHGRPFREHTAGAGSACAAGRATARAARVSRFADTRGVPASPEAWLDYDVIEAFWRPALRAGRRAPGAPTGRRCTGSPKRQTARRGSGQRRPGARAPAPYWRAERRSWPRWRPPSAARRNVPPRWRWSCSGSGGAAARRAGGAARR